MVYGNKTNVTFERQETQIVVPGPLLMHWVASGKSLKHIILNKHRVGTWQVGSALRSEGGSSAESRSVKTKPFAGIHCPTWRFAAGFKVDTTQGDPKMPEFLKLKELRETCHLKKAILHKS